MESFSKGLKVPLVLEAEPGRIVMRDAAGGYPVLIQEDFKLCTSRPVAGARGRVFKERHIRELPGSVASMLGQWLERVGHEYLDQFPDAGWGAYWNEESNRLLAAVLGPKFPQRWFRASMLAFIDPLNAALDPKLVQRFVRLWPAGAWDEYRVEWMNRYLEPLAQVHQDGYGKLVPLMYALGLPDSRDGRDILQQLRGLFSKAEWALLLGQPVSRLQRAAQLVNYRGYYQNEDRARYIASVLTVPTTLLRHQLDLGAEEVQVLANLAKQRPYKLGKEAPEYFRLVNYWQDLAQQGIPVSTTWSPRRIRDEHGRYMQDVRQRQVQHMIAHEQHLDQEFTLRYPYPTDYSDVKSRYQVRMLRTKRQYIEQGEREQHCLASHAHQGARGDVLVYVIATVAEDGYQVVHTTAEFHNYGGLNQNYGFRNSIVTNPDVLRIVDELGQRIRTVYEEHNPRAKQVVKDNAEEFEF
jgi:hypothetical protein